MAGRGNHCKRAAALERWDPDRDELRRVLAQYHSDRGTRGGRRIALRQARVAELLAGGLTLRDAAEHVGCSFATVRRDRQLILRVVA
jgi:hypothetical protein